MSERGESSCNLGVALLKLWLSVEVVMDHFWSPAKYPLFGDPGGLSWFLGQMRSYAVPCFMLLAFFFAAERFATLSGDWLRKRFVRLVLPCAVWTAVTFAVFSALPSFSDFARPTWKDFAYSVCGTNIPLGPHLWFMAVLILLTGLFAAFYRFVPERVRTAGLWTLLFVAIALDYSGVNYALFKTWHHDFQRPFGRVIPMVPYACLGLMAGLSRTRWSALPVRAKLLLAAAGAAGGAFLLNVPVFVKPVGYSYTGLQQLTVAVGFCTTAFFLPLEKVTGRLQAVLLFLSRYTMGVYLVHILVGRPLENFVFAHVGLTRQTFTGGCVVFVVAWLLCWAVSKIPGRWSKMLVQ